MGAASCHMRWSLLGVYTDFAVIHRARVRVAHLLPGDPAIIRAKDAALGVLDEGVDDVRVCAIYVYTYAPVTPSGSPFESFAHVAPPSTVL